MKKNTKTNLWFALLALALSLSAITFAAAKILHHETTDRKPVVSQNPSNVPPSNRNAYVRRAQLSLMDSKPKPHRLLMIST